MVKKSYIPYLTRLIKDLTGNMLTSVYNKSLDTASTLLYTYICRWLIGSDAVRQMKLTSSRVDTYLSLHISLLKYTSVFFFTHTLQLLLLPRDNTPYNQEPL